MKEFHFHFSCKLVGLFQTVQLLKRYAAEHGSDGVFILREGEKITLSEAAPDLRRVNVVN